MYLNKLVKNNKGKIRVGRGLAQEEAKHLLEVIKVKNQDQA